jgi:hypothetical protein
MWKSAPPRAGELPAEPGEGVPSPALLIACSRGEAAPPPPLRGTSPHVVCGNPLRRFAAPPPLRGGGETRYSAPPLAGELRRRR